MDLLSITLHFYQNEQFLLKNLFSLTSIFFKKIDRSTKYWELIFTIIQFSNISSVSSCYILPCLFLFLRSHFIVCAESVSSSSNLPKVTTTPALFQPYFKNHCLLPPQYKEIFLQASTPTIEMLLPLSALLLLSFVSASVVQSTVKPEVKLLNFHSILFGSYREK